MANFLGRMTLDYWIEADNIKEADRKLNKMLDQWDKATPEEITWDNWDRLIEEEREPEN
jgi:hypothetical protein